MSRDAVSITILPARAVWVDGRHVGAEETVAVSRAEADVYIAEGFAVLAGTPKPRRRLKPQESPTGGIEVLGQS